MTSRTITVGGPDADVPGRTSSDIQAAIESLGPTGGVVRLADGTFDIAAPVRLPSHVTLAGAGPHTVLRKIDGVIASPDDDADYGELVVRVPDPTAFAVGMGVQVREDGAVDWQCSTSVITAVEGRTIHLRDRLIKDYSVERGCTISNACSVIEIIDAEDVHVEHLSIDGNKATNEFLNGCRGGGVYIHRSRHCTCMDVTVADFNGDGISWQITEDITVDGCEVRGCTNFGLHPGTGSLRTRVTGCDVHDNGTDGLYVCWRVQDGTFAGNHIHHNGRHGVSLGHKDTGNLFDGNRIVGNGGAGVYFRPETDRNGAHRTRLVGSTIEDNLGGAVVIDSYTDDLIIDGTPDADVVVNAPAPGLVINGR